MSNTYFKLTKSVETKALPKPHGSGDSYKSNYKLSLTAFVGGENHTQLTIETDSSISNQSGCGYIVLNDKDVDLLIAGLLERKLGKISATGNEQSIFTPEEPD